MLEKKWLIKSENKILGPFQFDQISDLIKKKQVSLVDEVRDTETRWLYVRENPVFKQIVDEVRKDIESKGEMTKTYQTASKTVDLLAMKTKTAIPLEMHHYTDVNLDVQEASVVNEVLDQSPTTVVLQQEEVFAKEKTKLYGLPSDKIFKAEIKKSKFKNAMNMVIGVIVCVLIIFGFSFYQKYSAQRLEDEQLVLIKKYKVLEFDQKTVEVYSSLSNQLQKKLLPEVTSLFPLFEANGTLQTSDIETLKEAKGLNTDQKTNMFLALFWSAAQNQNLIAAQENLAFAGAIQPSSLLVLENEALIYLKKYQFLKAYNAFIDLYKKESTGRFLFGAAVAHKGLNSQEKEKASIELMSLLEKHTSTYFDYKKELLLILMALAKQSNNDVQFKVTWGQFVNTPPQLASLFKSPHLILPHSYQWKDLEDFKNLVRSSLNAEHAVLFDIHTLLETSQFNLANQYAENNLSRINDKAIRQQISLLIYHMEGRKNEVISLEKTNQLDPNADINHIILALNKLDLNPQADVSGHLQHLRNNQQGFYYNWISLFQLMKQNDNDKIKFFLRENYPSVKGFIPAIEAKSMIN